jgi:hypothetical protein
MIDIKNGGIILNINNFLIKKGLKKDEFEKSNLLSEVLNCQTYGFTSYFLKPQLIGNDSFSIVLYFNQEDIIDFVNLSLTCNDSSMTWNNWSEKKELKKKNEHDKWLLNNVGKPPYKYFWGEVSSNYDPRSGSSIITIKTLKI